MKKKLLISITNRSSYNKVKTIVSNLGENVEPTFLLGNSINIYRYGGIGHIIRNDFPKVRQLRIHLAVEGNDLHKMSKTVGLGVVEAATILDNEHFDAVLTVADRYETLAIAIAASYANVPLIHLQGGEITGTIDDKVRNAVSQLADIHFPATWGACERLSKMLKGDNKVYMYGCPSMDLFMESEYLGILREADIKDTEPPMQHFDDLTDDVQHTVNTTGTGDELDLHKDFIIVMLHSDTTDPTFSTEMFHLRDALNHLGMQEIIFWNNIDPVGDNIAKMWRERQIARRNKVTKTRYIRHLRPEIFGGLLWLASCIVGNSSTGIREASFLGTPSVNVGDRQHGREHDKNCVNVPFRKNEIVEAIESNVNYRLCKPSNLYGDGNAGYNIARRIDEILRNRL